jgi:hypothetical protein
MITSKENLETRFKELLTEKTEILKKSSIAVPSVVL